MAELDLSKSTTTEMGANDYIVDAKALDTENAGNGETYVYFEDAMELLGYYFNIPQIHSHLDILATYVAGKGYKTENPQDQIDLEHITGLGEDSFQSIMWNHQVVKKVVGDAFAQIITQSGVLINLIPISPERVKVVIKGGRILRYEIWDGSIWKILNPTEMLHSSNNRIGDQTHGTSQIEACKWLIDALEEAQITNRKIDRQRRALGIVEFATNDAGKISYANAAIKKAVDDGEMLGYGKDTMKLLDFPNKGTGDGMAWIQWLENKISQNLEVPKALTTTEGLTEAGGQVGFLTFEPIYTREQADLEADLYAKLGMKITFIRPPQLGGVVADNQDKNNAGALQPTDTTPIAPQPNL